MADSRCAACAFRPARKLMLERWRTCGWDALRNSGGTVRARLSVSCKSEGKPSFRYRVYVRGVTEISRASEVFPMARRHRACSTLAVSSLVSSDEEVKVIIQNVGNWR